jgi:elongation factor Ts
VKRSSFVELPSSPVILRSLLAPHQQGPAPAGRCCCRLQRFRSETARSIAQHISFADPQYLSRDDVPSEAVENERRIVEEISRGEGKPEAALPKIVEGRLGAFFKQVALLEQDYARDNKLQIKQVVEQAGITVSGFARFRVGA